ncbi:NUDIX domain-containing protein [Planococcus sp. ANT_H30]|uniref:NUDIX domain-containing protein n=1 Tax=Planococcus sp. ANT_H30 TaxID=2597347 RepID=UPI0011F05398|nr:NUDIX domain-containing protein [Planococcus sp. ANT_H30]KAA0955196.1 NUDIX domain-containing protein [Planococcus sp. ANT_H30]
MTTSYVRWGEATVKLIWEANDSLPNYQLITSVHGFCFYEGQLLLVELNHRGWDFPGGHIEENETPQDCFQREAMEEGYVSGDYQLLGHLIVDHSENLIWDENGKYPKVGYQVFYRMNIETLHPFKAEYESSQRIFAPINEVGLYYPKWNEIYQEILLEAANFRTK